MGNRAPRIVSETEPRPSLAARGAKVRHKGFVSLYEFIVDGIPVPDLEIVHYPRVTAVIPFDRGCRVVYMVEQVTLAAWLNLCGQPHLDNQTARTNGFGPDTPVWDETAQLGFPSGRLDQESRSPAAQARKELLGQVGFDRPESAFTPCGTFTSSVGHNDEDVIFFFVEVSGRPEQPTGGQSQYRRLWEIPLESLCDFLARRTISLTTALGLRLLREQP